MAVLRRPAQRRPSITYPSSRPRLWLPAAISPLPNGRSPPPSSTASVLIVILRVDLGFGFQQRFHHFRMARSPPPSSTASVLQLSFESTSALASSSDFTTSKWPFSPPSSTASVRSTYPSSRPRLRLPAAISPLPNGRSPPPSSTASVRILILRVDLGFGFQQRFHHFRMPVHRRPMQRRLPLVVLCIDVCTTLQQRHQYVSMSVPCSKMQCCQVGMVRHIYVDRNPSIGPCVNGCICEQQEADHLRMISLHSQMKTGSSLLIFRIDVNASVY